MLSPYDVPGDFMSHLRINTCSRKYDSWKDLIYDPDRRYRPDDYLPDYARHFTAVEMGQWFWSMFPAGVGLPDQEAVRRYADSVPDSFRFTVKVPNAITPTHPYAKQPKRSLSVTIRAFPHTLSIISHAADQDYQPPEEST